MLKKFFYNIAFLLLCLNNISGQSDSVIELEYIIWGETHRDPIPRFNEKKLVKDLKKIYGKCNFTGNIQYQANNK